MTCGREHYARKRLVMIMTYSLEVFTGGMNSYRCKRAKINYEFVILARISPTFGAEKRELQPHAYI